MQVLGTLNCAAAPGSLPRGHQVSTPLNLWESGLDTNGQAGPVGTSPCGAMQDAVETALLSASRSPGFSMSSQSLSRSPPKMTRGLLDVDIDVQAPLGLEAWA